jgi:hypothetical protein
LRRSNTSASRRAEELVAGGHLLDAIDVLTEANRVRRDPALEARLVELRRDAHRCAPPADDAPTWPPASTDTFPDAVGPPEIIRDELTAEALRSGILHHGCLLVRNLLDPPRVTQLVNDIDHAFAAYEAHVAGSPVADTAPWFVPFDPGPNQPIHREWIRHTGGGVLAVDSPRALFDVIETFEQLGIRALLTDYLQEAPRLLGLKTTLRRVEPQGEPDWHQDGAFMGANIRSVDIWISLSHCGVDAPGLDIVSRRLDGIVDTGTDGADYDWSVGTGAVERLAGEGVIQPVFEPGDALIFDHLLLHRTGVHPGMTRARYAVEAWFAAPSSYPSDQVAIAY